MEKKIMDDKNIHCHVWTEDGGYQSLTIDEYLEFDETRFHRVGGPANISDHGEAWWYKGKVSRVDGPAVVDKDGSVEWWLDNKPLPTEEVEAWIKENQIDLSTEEGQMAFVLMWS